MSNSRVPFSLLCLCHTIVYQNQGDANINFDTNKYLNIFISKKRISEDIRIKKMIRTNIHNGKYSNVRIHSYQFLILVLDWMLEVGFLMCDTTER